MNREKKTEKIEEAKRELKETVIIVLSVRHTREKEFHRLPSRSQTCASHWQYL
jgi:5-bromo-4-chloroindolyl phosphate hydrolysis protein